jgi:hypothetical protein
VGYCGSAYMYNVYPACLVLYPWRGDTIFEQPDSRYNHAEPIIDWREKNQRRGGGGGERGEGRTGVFSFPNDLSVFTFHLEDVLRMDSSPDRQQCHRL